VGTDRSGVTPHKQVVIGRIQKSVLESAMKTTLNLNDTLLAEAKALAAKQRTSLTRLIEEGLQLRLRSRPERTKPLHLPVYKGKGGLVQGVDGLSNRALLEAADRDT
jgi:hypothetical protein